MERGEVLGGRYELLAPIAEGASGTVWAAQDAESGDEVAIKAVSLERAGWRAEVRDRFQQEARLLALAPHQNLVGVRGFGETDDGHLYLVLQMLRGETLADRLARPPLPSWQEAAAIALALGRGLAALHAQGIVHRDLKPANVILHQPSPSDPIVPKIIDLGISKVRAAALDPVLRATLTATGQVLGTPQYMSYEQALGEPDIDPRSDVWSLGVVLYEMLAGRPPFVAPNVNAVLAAIRRGNPPPLRLLPQAPASLEAITLRCLQREKSARFADASALVRALEEATRTRLLARSMVAVAAGIAVAGLVGALVLALRPPAPEPASSAIAPAPPPPRPAEATPGAGADTARPGPVDSPAETSVPTPSPRSVAAPPPRPRGRPVTRINDAGF